MSFGRGTSEIKRASKDTRIVLIQIDEGSVTLTPFGSLSRMNPIRVSGRSLRTLSRGQQSVLEGLQPERLRILPRRSGNRRILSEN